MVKLSQSQREMILNVQKNQRNFASGSNAPKPIKLGDGLYYSANSSRFLVDCILCVGPGEKLQGNAHAFHDLLAEAEGAPRQDLCGSCHSLEVMLATFGSTHSHCWSRGMRINMYALASPPWHRTIAATVSHCCFCTLCSHHCDLHAKVSLSCISTWLLSSCACRRSFLAQVAPCREQGF